MTKDQRERLVAQMIFAQWFFNIRISGAEPTREAIDQATRYSVDASRYAEGQIIYWIGDEVAKAVPSE